MSPDGTDGHVGSEHAATFGEALDRLKRRGCMLLLVGAARRTAMTTACQRLLGDPGAGRRRLFVYTNDGACAHTGAGSLGGEARTARAIRYRTPVRSAAAAPGGSAAAVPERAVDGDLSALFEAVAGEVEAFAHADFDAGDLRLCVDAADTLVDTRGERATFEFLHALGGLVRRHRGMGHVHLPVDRDTPAVSALAPAFDAVVEVRANDRPEQRWHLLADDVTTDWLAL